MVLHLGDIQKHVFNEQLVPTFLENFQAFNLLTKSPKQQSLNSMEEVIQILEKMVIENELECPHRLTWPDPPILSQGSSF